MTEALRGIIQDRMELDMVRSILANLEAKFKTTNEFAELIWIVFIS